MNARPILKAIKNEIVVKLVQPLQYNDIDDDDDNSGDGEYTEFYFLVAIQRILYVTEKGE